VTDVDAVVVNWETRDCLRQCLDALLAQPGVQVRVIVVDNASHDGSADMVAADYPQVTLLRQQVNIGYTRATNLGLGACTAPYVVLCNPDCELAIDSLGVLVSALSGTHGAAGVAPRLLDERGEPQGFVFRFPRLIDAFACYTEMGQHIDRRVGGRFVRRYDREDLKHVAGMVGVEHPAAACILLRRELLVGGLDAAFPIFFSDTDLCWRLREQGYSLYLEPAARARHLLGASVNRVPWPLVLHELQRGLRRFYRLHHNRRRQAAVTMILAADVVVRAAVHGVRHRSMERALGDLAMLPRLLSDRPGPGVPWVEGDAGPIAAAITDGAQRA
jgi:N-acetylglucosaminyl-diphospho-decaprenol L-rhamnosyltransferase